jgi:hypothetical protein
VAIHTTHTRDAALRELGRLNRWLVAGSVTLTGLFAEAAASAFPGKTVKPATAHMGKHAAKHTPTPATTSTQALQPPAEAPRAGAESQSSAQAGAPAQESAPAQEPAPAQESAPSQESAPAQESAPVQESAPEPVVSGGS